MDLRPLSERILKATHAGVLLGRLSSLIKQQKTFPIVALLLAASSSATQTGKQAAGSPPTEFDVIDYDAQLEPDIANKTITGKVVIRLIVRKDAETAIELDCGDLTIDAVREKGEPRKFVPHDHRLSVSMPPSRKANETREIEVDYHGAPKYGIRFFPERTQVYTVFSTSQWLVCVDAQADRATLRLKLVLPSGLDMVANGRMVKSGALPDGRILHEWRQETPVPTYTFGFAAGRFHALQDAHGHVRLRYLAGQFSDKELRRIFRDTADMISFYEDRAGVRYGDGIYTQVLAAGGVEQEMAGFTVMRESYGKEVLADERAVWLAAHELAHQWWGNMVTCRDWTHFWLNEGMATFMAAAYKGHRFGEQEYQRHVEESRARYQKVRDAGKDRSLVFPDWSHPTADDRALVYHKGAWVFHLLRGELGDRAFWAGIRRYTGAYSGKSVTTADFQRAMEESSGRDLHEFFGRWVYQ